MSVNLSIDAAFLGFKDEDHEDIKLEVNGRTVGDCLSLFLATKPDLKENLFDKTGKLDSDVYVFVNNSPVVLDQLRKEVKNGDKVRIMFTRENG
jgi:molybdopterin converting factor small subunit